jgi:hypothetical protein
MMLMVKPKDSEKHLSLWHVVHYNATGTEIGSNPGLRGKNPATNRLSYGTAKLRNAKLIKNIFKMYQLLYCIYCGP